MRSMRAVGAVVTTLVLGAGALAGLTAPASADTDAPSGSRVAAGYSHTLFVAADGVPYATGSNTNGQLTGDTNANEIPPTAMTGLPAGVTAAGVAAGGYQSLVLGSDGVVYIAGNDQVAGGPTDGVVRTLTAVPGLPLGVTATAVAAGTYHVVVLGSDGKVYGIGDNGKGQLTGMTATLDSLTVMSGLPGGVTAERIAAGIFETYVVGSDGIAYGTGRNSNSELTGMAGQRDTLTPLAGLPDGVDAVDVAGGDGHALVIGSDGQAYGAGYNAHGQLTGTGGGWKDTLTKLTGLPEGVTAISVDAGVQFSVVLGSDGVAYAAGFNDRGQVTGTGDKTDLTPLATLPSGVTATAVSAGDNFSLVLGSDGVFYGAGDNRWGQITTGVEDQLALTAVPGQPLVNTVLPTVGGTAVVGQVLAAAGGTWLPAPSGVSFQWKAGSAVVGAGPSYTVKAADVGKTITVTETAERDGFVIGTATSAATATVSPVVVPPVVKATSKTKAGYVGASKIKAGKKGGKVQVTVTAVPSVAVAGKVSIVDTFKAKGKKARTKTLSTTTLAAAAKGKLTIKLPKLAKGKHTLVVRYLGSATVKPSAASKQVFTVR